MKVPEDIFLGLMSWYFTLVYFSAEVRDRGVPSCAVDAVHPPLLPPDIRDHHQSTLDQTTRPHNPHRPDLNFSSLTIQTLGWRCDSI